MEEFLNLFNQYARSELMILIPVLYIVAKMLGSTRLNKSIIPLVVSAVSVVLCATHTLSNVPLDGVGTVFLALFTSFTQGILYAGVTLFGGVMLNPQRTADGLAQELARVAALKAASNKK